MLSTPDQQHQQALKLRRYIDGLEFAVVGILDGWCNGGRRAVASPSPLIIAVRRADAGPHGDMKEAAVMKVRMMVMRNGSGFSPCLGAILNAERVATMIIYGLYNDCTRID